MRRTLIYRLLMLIVLVLGTAGATLFVMASVRYGGPSGLVLRVRAEIAGYRPHDLLVPTPLPTEESQAVGIAPAGNTPLPTVTDTVTPSVAPTSTPEMATAVVAATATGLAEPTITTTPSATAEPTAVPLPSPTPAYMPAAPSIELTGFTHEWQTWNNCGPATLAMYLSHYGTTLTQADIGDVLRPDKDDKHVGPEEIADYARGQGFQAIVRVNGNPDLVRTLLSNGLPVMMPTWHEDKPNDGMGHYRLLTGYNDAREEWTVYDSLAGQGTDLNAPYQPVHMSYTQFAQWWAVMNHTYIVIYPEKLAPTVEAILGDQMDDATMWAQALQDAQTAVDQHPQDAFAWFNLGTNLVGLQRYNEAAAAYDKARTIGLPWRMLWYQFGPFQAYYGSGRFKEVIALADATLAVTTHVEELHYWKAMALQATGDLDGARQSLKRALALKPGYPDAVAALNTLGGQ